MEDQDEAPPPKKQRFKHLTFNQCVASIGGDSAKFSKRLSHRPDDSELFFTEALTKWNDQDFGAHYTSFVDSLPCDELSTHAQLLYHKNTITKLLLKYLQDQKCKSVQAFCELLSALVRDLKEDFRDDMWDFFDALTNVLDLGERDVESVEAAFFTLSLIVKIMWRTLIKNFVSSFVHFIPLFGSSRPYVRRFAAESFSLVMRKSSKLSTISQHVVEQAYKVQDERLTEGCAELFFYVCKGIAGGFHSAAKEQIGSIITGVLKLSDPHVREYGMTILEKGVQFIVTYVQKTSRGDLSFLEVALIGMMENASTLQHCTSLVRLLSLCFVQRKWKNLFSSQERLQSAIEKVMTTPFFELNPEFIDFFSKSIHAVFCDEEWGSRVGQTCAKMVSLDDSFSLMLDLFDNVRDIAYFDRCLLPVIGKLSQQLLSKEPTLSSRLLSLYSSICMKERPIQNVFSRSRVPIFDVAHHQCVREHVIELTGRLASIERSVVASVLLIWPWIFDGSDQILGVDNVVSFLKDLLSGDHYSLEASQLALIAGSSLYQVDKLALRSIEPAELERFVRCTNCCESSLRLYRIYLECNENALGEGELKRVSDLLTPCYFNPNAYVRKCALEILNSFNFTVNGTEDEGCKYSVSNDENLFAIMLAAECCDIIDSRGRLLQFRKLIFDHHQRYMPRGSDVTYDHVILRISLAQFFVQFTKLWPSMYDILESFARGMDIDGFWSIMAEILDQVNDGCREHGEKESTIRFLPWCDKHDRFDYRSARIQILKFMANIPDIAQRRTRILSPMVLKIYESDYLPLIAENLSSLSKGDQLENAEGADIRAGAAEEGPDTSYETLVHVTKALCAFLDVYAKFTDPKSVYLEPKMRNMYEHLLIVGNDMVQKSALACIFSYRDKSLLPYKENFERLLDEKTFREQLVLFTINEEENNSIVHLDHRQKVMHILLRFLYGKLWIKTKRHLAESRRAAIFRYLGGCRPQELLEFLKILFAPVLEVIGTDDLDYKRMDVLCSDNKVLFKMDFGKISRCLSSVSNLLVRIARVIVEEQRTMLFRLLLATAVVIKAAIVHPDTPSYLSRKLRDLRMSLMDRLAEFLSAYPQRPFSTIELKGVMEYVVLPYLSLSRSVRDEPLVVAPLSVIKLLAAVCAYPTHYHILALRFEWDDHRGSLIELMISPLLWAGLTPHMSNIIRKAVLNLLTLADEPIAFTDLEYEDVPKEKGRNYGTSIVVAHIKPIIQFLADAVETSMKTFNASNLELLSRLSAYTPDGSLARKMASTIMGHIEKKIPKEGTLKKLLDVIACLMSNVISPEEFLRRIGPLFSKTDSRATHESLVRIVEGLMANDLVGMDIKRLLKLVVDLESWDRSRIDEPDHDRRHAAYNRLNEIWNSDDALNVDLLRIFVHTHFNTLSTTKDISLRASSGSNLRALIQYFSKIPYDEAEKLSFLNAELIHVYVIGMRSQNEIVREECVKCLALLADCFPDHPQLKQLLPLRNSDEDVDFFTNIIHIQYHRRQRAIHRLVEQLSSGKVVIGFDVLNKYLIPIVLPYLANTESKLSALSDEGLSLLNYAMGIASWPKYVACLDSWLKHLDKSDENQKATIRVIVAVVEAFHYDVADVGETVSDDGTNETRVVIRDKLNRDVLPRLTKCINGKSAELSVHRKARTAATKYYSEDDDIKRAPVALATVKLLQKVPDSIRSQYLHGVILKLCSLMISRSMNVRETARKVGVQVCECLGPRYLPVIIKEMKLIMKKGFQVHVMIYTIHTFIAALRDVLKTGDLDACLDDVLDIVVKEQFEAVSEEKEVGEIKAEVSEAKKNPTPGTLLLFGRYVSSSVVGTLLNRFVTVVDSLTSAKMISRARNLLSMFANGLKDNQGFSPTSQLILIHQMIVTNIEKMRVVADSHQTADEVLEKPKSCLLLPPEPKRIGVLTKTVLKSRSHIFLEFALQLLGSLITGKKFDRSDSDHIRRLDPFVSLVTQSLEFKYEKVISHALRCLIGMLHMSLPSIEKSLNAISERLFLLLSEYSILGSAANKESVLNLNQLLCKTFTQLIITSNASFLTDKHVSLLLSYVEIDILDTSRQATAFALIKAFVRKKVQHPQMADVMKKLRELAITSSFPHIRTQCREVLCDFIGNHPSSDDPQTHIEWFIAQLDYDLEDGRLSAADMLNSLFSKLQPAVLNGSCFFNVSKMGTALFNEESVKCRRFISAALNKLMSSVSESARSDVFSACCDWLELKGEEQEGARYIAVDLLIQISKVEGEAFAPRFASVLPSLRAILASESLWSDNSERTISTFCHGIASVLQNLGASAGDVLVSEDFCAILDSLGPLMKCDGSEMVRLSAGCLIGQCLSKYNAVVFNAERSAQLIQWCCWQLRDKLLSEQIALQASKILMAISRHLSGEQFTSLVEKLASICRFEIVRQPNVSLKRSTCFKMAAALIINEEDSTKVDVTAEHFLPLLVREMNRKSSKDTEELYSMSMEVGDVFKAKLGEQRYATQLAECQKAAVIKTELRKRKAKELVLTNPEEAAALKRKKNVKKTESRKRKIDVLKPYRVMNRQHAERIRAEQNEED